MLCASLLVVGAVHAAQPDARQILARASRHYDAVRDYTVDARIAFNSPAVHVPQMDMKIYFKAPDKLHVESTDGFAMFPKQGVIFGNPVRELRKGTELSMRSDRLRGVDCYVIRSNFLKKGQTTQSTVWIDKKDSLVRQISTNPNEGPEAQVRMEYSRVNGKYWLPSKTLATVSLPRVPGAKPGPSTTVTFNFANYQVNKGLSDKIFKVQGGHN